MASNKRMVPPFLPALPARLVRFLTKAAVNSGEWRSKRWIAALTAIACLPFAMWLVGSGIVWATPAVYRSTALVRAGESGPAARAMKSTAVIEKAAKALAGRKASRDPMAAYLLWSSITVTPDAGPEVVKLEARSNDAAEARRMVLAVAESYRALHGQAGSLVYVDPVELAPRRVSDETRMVLGVAGMATLCLVLCVPLLCYVERRMPVRKIREAVSGFGGELAGSV